jgi:hypothetical protein
MLLQAKKLAGDARLVDQRFDPITPSPESDPRIAAGPITLGDDI